MSDAEGRPSIIIYETLSGVIFHIKPINLATLRAIQSKAVDKFPYPDPKPYQQLEDNAFAEGQLSPAEDSPEYVEACKAVDVERARWADRAIFNYAAEMPKYPTEAALVEAFKEPLEKLREIANLEGESDYDNILLHIVLSGNKTGLKGERYMPADSDYVQIIRAAIQVTPLTAAEVAEGVRFFRIKI